MAEDLFPEFDLEEDDGGYEEDDPESAENAVQAIAAPMFDFDKGEFITDNTGKVVIADQFNAWVQWCQKTVMTQADAAIAYDETYGIDKESALAKNSRGAKQVALEDTIRSALLADPYSRTLEVESFEWTDAPGSDHMYCTVTLQHIAQIEAQIEVTI
ncbi:MAG: DUF2634 domain-containing protein [Eubacteriaceae bacterium]|nr:DUF2634 domain-containing protein [Eubacteriaceae bacterium]